MYSGKWDGMGSLLAGAEDIAACTHGNCESRVSCKNAENWPYRAE